MANTVLRPRDKQLLDSLTQRLAVEWDAYFSRAESVLNQLNQRVTDLESAQIDLTVDTGYLRLSTIQIAFGTYTSTTVAPLGGATFAQPFANTNYRLVLTPQQNGTDPRFSKAVAKAAGSFTAQTYTDAGGLSAVGGEYIAIGTY